MLSEAENIEPDLIGKLDFLNEFPQPARTFRPTAIGGVARHTSRSAGRYQPSNVVWSMIETPQRERREKKHVYRARCAEGALSDLEAWLCGVRRER